MIIVIGPPASGKSTFIKNCIPSHFSIVDPDKFVGYERDRLGDLVEKEIMSLLQFNNDFVIDVVGHNPFILMNWLDMAKEKNFKTKVIFMNTKLNKCIKRNKLRERNIPSNILFEKYFKCLDSVNLLRQNGVKIYEQ